MNCAIHYKYPLLIILFWTFFAQGLRAQQTLSFYQMRDQFNSSDFNPAFLYSPERFTFSIFPIAGFSVQANNQDLIREALPKYLAGEKREDDYDDLFLELIERPSLHQSAEAILLSFTYRNQQGFFNFRIKDRQFFDASIDGKLTDFIFTSDIQTVPLNKSYSYPLQAAHYREYSIGYSHTSRDRRLLTGIRGKLYFGKFAVYSTVEGFIGSLNNQYGLATTGMINLSYPATVMLDPLSNTYEVDMSKSTINSYLWNNKNPGLGVDLGFHYELSQKVNISASLIDFGFINWKKNPANWDMTNAYPFYYATYGVEDKEGVPTITKRETYRYSDTFNFYGTKKDSSAFVHSVPATIYAGIGYEVRPGFTLSATNRYVISKDLGFYSVALGATIDINERLTLNTGYSLIGDSFFNIPLAFLYKHKRGQIYAGTDNINILFTSNGPYWASINFGASFYLFTQRNLLLKRSERLPFYQPRKFVRNKESGLRVKSKDKD